MSTPPQKVTAKTEIVFSSREEAALRVHMRNKEPPLAPSAQAALFEGFLNGQSCEEMALLNRGWQLGAIVRACVEGDWHARKSQHLDSILHQVKSRVEQVQVESVLFTANLLAAANKKHGIALRKYLISGDEKDLDGLAINSLKAYKEAVELLMKLTGQDTPKPIKTIDQPLHDPAAVAKPVVTGPPTKEEAAQALETLEMNS